MHSKAWIYGATNRCLLLQQGFPASSALESLAPSKKGLSLHITKVYVTNIRRKKKDKNANFK